MEWFAGETPETAAYKGGRPHFGFRYNLFDHQGVTSTLRPAKQGKFPKCFEELVWPVVFKIEAWDKKQCPNDDLTPCPPKSVPRVDWGTLFGNADV